MNCFGAMLLWSGCDSFVCVSFFGFTSVFRVREGLVCLTVGMEANICFISPH